MPLVESDPEKIFCERVLQRPIVNSKSLTGLKQLTELHREKGRRFWFCGSYASGGVPLLESGVTSSIAVRQALALRLGNLQLRLTLVESTTGLSLIPRFLGALHLYRNQWVKF